METGINKAKRGSTIHAPGAAHAIIPECPVLNACTVSALEIDYLIIVQASPIDRDVARTDCDSVRARRVGCNPLEHGAELLKQPRLASRHLSSWRLLASNIDRVPLT